MNPYVFFKVAEVEQEKAAFKDDLLRGAGQIRSSVARALGGRLASAGGFGGRGRGVAGRIGAMSDEEAAQALGAGAAGAGVLGAGGVMAAKAIKGRMAREALRNKFTYGAGGVGAGVAGAAGVDAALGAGNYEGPQ